MGASMTSDGYHIVAPDPNGEQAGHAMTRAVQLAGLSPADIDHINAHATGTSVGDVAEGKAINNAMGRTAPRSTRRRARWAIRSARWARWSRSSPVWRCGMASFHPH